MKHILYVSPTLPTPGFGSSVIIYRHLKRLKDWKISIIVDDDSAAKRYELPKDWGIIKTVAPRWWLPIKRRIPWLLNLRLNLLTAQYEKALKDERPSAILCQLGKNSLLAYRLSKASGVPLNIILHDRWQAWNKFGTDKFMIEESASSVLNHASRVWPVSQKLGDYYKVSDPKKIKMLYPIPEGSPADFAQWQEIFKTNLTIGLAGSFHSPQLKDLENVAGALRRINGKLLIISKKNELIKSHLKDYSNIVYKEPLPENSQLLAYLKDNVSCILISGSIDTRGEGWQLSFPSRLVEFSHLGVPIIIVAKANTVLSNWAKLHNWVGHVESQDKKHLEGLVNAITERELWLKMAEQSRNVAQSEFDPERIQEQFERELVMTQHKAHRA